MSIMESSEIRELTAGEVKQISGGEGELDLGPIGYIAWGPGGVGGFIGPFSFFINDHGNIFMNFG